MEYSLSKLKLNPAIICSPVDLFYVLTNWLYIIGRLNRIIIKTVEIKIIGNNIIVLFKNMPYQNREFNLKLEHHNT